MSSENHRVLCLKCFRSVKVCACAQLRPFNPGAKIVFLVHPKEAKKTTGTARLAHLLLQDSEYLVAPTISQNSRALELLRNDHYFPLIVYPGDEAHDLSLGPPSFLQAPLKTGKKLLIFLIDGSWSCAKKIMRLSPALHQLPRLAFTPQKPSEYYLIRRQPHPYCLSTIEATSCVLEYLKEYNILTHFQQENLQQLLIPFQNMVKQQLAFRNDPSVPGYRRKPAPIEVLDPLQIPISKKWQSRPLFFTGKKLAKTLLSEKK